MKDLFEGAPKYALKAINVILNLGMRSFKKLPKQQALDILFAVLYCSKILLKSPSIKNLNIRKKAIVNTTNEYLKYLFGISDSQSNQQREMIYQTIKQLPSLKSGAITKENRLFVLSYLAMEIANITEKLTKRGIFPKAKGEFALVRELRTGFLDEILARQLNTRLIEPVTDAMLNMHTIDTTLNRVYHDLTGSLEKKQQEKEKATFEGT